MKGIPTGQLAPKLVALTPTVPCAHQLQLISATSAILASMLINNILVLRAQPTFLNALTAIPAVTPSTAQPVPQGTTSTPPPPVPPAPAVKPTVSTATPEEQAPFGASIVPVPTTSPTTLQEPALSAMLVSPTALNATRTAPSPTTSAACTASQGIILPLDRPAAQLVLLQSPTAMLVRRPSMDP